jgi:hypothetical protein
MEQYFKWTVFELMADNGFDALLTFDKYLQHQQNIKKYTIAVFVLSAVNNTYLVLTGYHPKYTNTQILLQGNITNCTNYHYCRITNLVFIFLPYWFYILRQYLSYHFSSLPLL